MIQSHPSQRFFDRFKLDAAGRSRYWWPFVMLVAAFAYLYSLDGLHIPNIGDEAPYYRVTRLTAETGNWLPLAGDEQIKNTKPPLLFWQGIVSTSWGENWSLFRLRLPIVIYTFLTAGLVLLLTKGISGNKESGYLGALSFLGFSSTFQQGRPFLTNLPETFFIFLPFFLLFYFRRRIAAWGLPFWLIFGLLVGVATLYRSFVVVVPVGVALSGYFLLLRSWDIRSFIKKDAFNIALAMAVAMACFGLWPLLDPDPQAVFEKFFLKENIGKLGGGDYFLGLFSGTYPISRIWLGHFTNAGLLALPLIYLVVISIKERKKLSLDEKALWILVLAYLIVYTIPSQRQENYLLPSVPALAVLLGLRWGDLKRRWFYLLNIPLILILILFTVLIFSISAMVLPSGSYNLLHFVAPIGGLVLAVAATIYNKSAPYSFHFLVLVSFLALASVLAPFEGPLGRYGPDTVAALVDKTVYMPSNFGAKYERHRFFLTNTDIEGYHPRNTGRRDELLASGYIVGVNFAYGETDYGPYKVFGKRLDLKSRQTPEEVSQIIFNNRLDLLFQQEVILQRRTGS